MQQQVELKNIIGDYDEFMENVSRSLIAARISKSELAMCDHLCFRTETCEEYQDLLAKLRDVAELLDEAEIAGRPIAVFSLYKPIEIDGWTIPYIEVPSPKPGSPYKSGLEHAEFVTVRDLNQFLKAHPDIEFTKGGLEKSINPEIGMRMNGSNVKFHEIPLGPVVRLQETFKTV